MQAHEKAREIIETHREQHKLIAEKLLEFETLDAKAIKSLFETGKMPEGKDSLYPSEKAQAQTFEEAKRALEEKDAEKQAEDKAPEHKESDDEITPDDTNDNQE